MSEKKKGTAKKIITYIGRILAVISTTLGMVLLCAYGVMVVCTHGPSPVARNLFVLSVRESSAGGFLANMVVSSAEIKQIEENNKVADTDEVTDTELIDFKGNENDVAEDLDKDGMKPYLEENGMLFYKVSGPTYAGTMIVVKDPSRVFVGTSGDYEGEAGMSVPNICEKYDAALAINAGGFEDNGGVGDGGTPLGFVFSEGKLKFGGTDERRELIGFDDENVFVVGSMTGKEATDMGIRDAVSFGPFLVMNGKPMEVTGLGGGLNPRTAIGQRADGSVLLLVIDGRQAHSLGANLNDLVNVMMQFGAVNAANLDGGGSTVLYYDGEVQNSVSSIYGTRGVPTAILVKKE